MTRASLERSITVHDADLSHWFCFRNLELRVGYRRSFRSPHTAHNGIQGNLDAGKGARMQRDYARRHGLQTVVRVPSWRSSELFQQCNVQTVKCVPVYKFGASVGYYPYWEAAVVASSEGDVTCILYGRQLPATYHPFTQQGAAPNGAEHDWQVGIREGK
jgi:hypothetical protein